MKTAVTIDSPSSSGAPKNSAGCRIAITAMASWQLAWITPPTTLVHTIEAWEGSRRRETPIPTALAVAPTKLIQNPKPQNLPVITLPSMLRTALTPTAGQNPM